MAYTPYDEFRYPGKFFPQASPAHMAVLATLFGLIPPPVERSRVLELGCGEGGHLTPLAYMLPQSSFLGIDLSPEAIRRAQDLAARIGLRNVEFRAQDMAGFPDDAGGFDYIIAHGVYSWVPEAAREALLQICARHLAANGVVYISYNAYPGAHLRQIPRDLALFHTRATPDSAAKVREAHAILDLIVGSMPGSGTEQELFRALAAHYKTSAALTRFDLLSEENQPSYFLDFMEKAAASGLQFVAECDLKFMRTAPLPEPVRRWLEAIPDRLLREQYLDFIHLRSFRKTILCRAEQALDLYVTPQRMAHLMVAGSLAPRQTIDDFHSGEAVEFHTLHGRRVSCTEALPKAVYCELGAAFPRALPYAELKERACRRLGRDQGLDPAAEAGLIRMLVAACADGGVDFRVYEVPFAAAVTERPVASAVARIQAQTDGEVASMYMAAFTLEDPIMRALLCLLDGTRTRSQLLRDLDTRLDKVERRTVTPEALDRALKLLASFGLLVG